MVQSLCVRELSFGFSEKPLFDKLSLNFSEENPVIFLGPSGCGKTTLLRLMAGLLEPWSGYVAFSGKASGISFVFQEPRLLPWLTVWENVVLPIKKTLPPKEAKARGAHFLELVSLKDKMRVYPDALSGGQRQRVSIARAFTYPSQIMFMDEPFQSLDIPLRIELMEMTLSLFAEEPRLLIAVTHDPREAIFLGRRILVLGKPPRGVIFDETAPLFSLSRVYGSPTTSELEARLLQSLSKQ
ncbi:MAG: ABC transporter ATP-binding protein [Treponema sp.]|jgi:NitT/TauT family transport system ATP-binding protein|nr:ABC transporter ATP-binding protein [Treponema sp.]